ncbi:hypothetical protein BD413DRAFT_570385 [Trametes elegans]|nr:hypothetical protein BD413DRAFT_570385 [Trametes elegans]
MQAMFEWFGNDCIHADENASNSSRLAVRFCARTTDSDRYRTSIRASNAGLFACARVPHHAISVGGVGMPMPVARQIGAIERALPHCARRRRKRGRGVPHVAR